MVLLALLLATDPGALAGKVTLSGLAPKLANLPVTRDMKVCGANKPADFRGVGKLDLLVAVFGWRTTGEVLYLENRTTDWAHPVFVPHVLVAPVSATVEVVNSDKALHQVRAQAGDFRLMNYAMPIPGHLVPTKLTNEGIFNVNCDVHPWMRAWLLVLPTAAYAVTGPEGTYRVADVPPGKHKVKFWHERLGERDAEIEIQPGRTAVHDLQYNPR